MFAALLSLSLDVARALLEIYTTLKFTLALEIHTLWNFTPYPQAKTDFYTTLEILHYFAARPPRRSPEFGQILSVFQMWISNYFAGSPNIWARFPHATRK